MLDHFTGRGGGEVSQRIAFVSLAPTMCPIYHATPHCYDCSFTDPHQGRSSRIRQSIDTIERESAVSGAPVTWYRQYGRDLPWRKTSDPYRILVSEVMLQQTQVDRVIPKYHEFLERYPSFHHLAEALIGRCEKNLVSAWL